MFRLSIAFVLLFGILALPFTTADAWSSVAMDSTGKYLTASTSKTGQYYGLVYTSDDYGANWKAGTTQIPWSSIASDSTGQKLAGVATCNPSSYCYSPWESTDRGATWNMTTATVPKDNYYSISADSTGMKQVIAGGEGILQSGDGGKSWGRYDLPEGYNGNVVAMSASGTAVLFDFMDILTLNTGSFPYKPLKVPEANWRGVGIDSAGQVLSGAYDMSYGSGGSFESAWYVSTDGGATFTAVKLTNEGEKYYTVAVSADGKYVHCGGSEGIYTYNVASKAVTKSNAPTGGYYSIATSQNGKYVLAATGNLYLSSDYGATYTKVY